MVDATAGGVAAGLLDDLLICRALILRHLRRRHAGNPFGIFMEFLRPVVICAAHYLYFTMTRRAVPGNQYAIFTLGGFTIWFTFAAACSAAFEGGKWPNGITQIAGVTRMHMRAAGSAWAFALYFTFTMLVAIPLQMFGQDIGLPDVALSLACFGMAAGLGFGYGLICSSIGIAVPALIPFLKILQWAVFITSGVYDSLVTMPQVMAAIIQYNPLIDLAEYQRHAFYAGYPVYLVTLSYPAMWVLGLILAGLVLNRALCSRRA